MTIKVTLFFQLATNTSQPTATARRLGGWTESYYFPGTDVNAAIVATNGKEGSLFNLTRTRAELLPQGAAIVGQRFQLVAPTIGQAQSTSFNAPGTSGNVADVPQMALLITVPGMNSPNIRRIILRGLPDIMVVDGEYSPTNGFRNSLSDYFASLSQFAFRGRDLTQPANKIIQVATDGTVSSEQPMTFTVTQMVRVLKTQTSTGALKGGRFQVTTTGPLITNVKLLGWNLGPTTGGVIRADAITYPMFNTALAAVGRVVVKKVGRPFTQYRGRRSKKRV